MLPIWRLLEAGQGDLPPPYWAFAWVGGIALARYLLDHPEEVFGQRVLDFGAGSGLCAIAASKAGATEVLACDIDPWAGIAIELNAQANGVVIPFTVDDQLLNVVAGVDVILAGDVCYEGPMAARVLAWLRAASAGGVRVLVGDPGRTYFPASEFSPLAEYELASTRELEERDLSRAGVYRLRVGDLPRREAVDPG